MLIKSNNTKLVELPHLVKEWRPTENRKTVKAVNDGLDKTQQNKYTGSNKILDYDKHPKTDNQEQCSDYNLDKGKYNLDLYFHPISLLFEVGDDK